MSSVSATDTRVLDFATDVQPILRRNCYRCHGTKNQEAGLQLNRRDTAFGDPDSNEPIIARHNADTSLMIQRLVDEDLGDIMPLDGNALSVSEIEVLSRWIDQGAKWPDEYADAKHWAYQSIRDVSPPSIEFSEQDKRAITPIDQFVRRRLQSRGLQPSPSADRPRLIRRVSLALTGIPPTLKEVQQFVADPQADAYQKVVDRLLRSERYGEHWAVPWLDMARYADSNGFQADQIRDNWAYRDWVIRSFNADYPFNEFVIDQIAGDLRPGATIDHKIATGFHRMTTCNVEAGVHPEANRTNQIIDRVNTTATVFMGTTMECAQCHDHKYDPFTQQDYYRLFAYFNNTPLEVKNTSGVTWDFFGPKMDLPMAPEKESQQERLVDELADLQQQRDSIHSASDDEFQSWLARLRKSQKSPVQWQPAVPIRFVSTANESHEILDDGAVLLTGSVPDTVEHIFAFDRQAINSDGNITAIRIDLLIDDRIPGKGPGRGDAKRSNVILSELNCELVRDEKTSPILLQDPTADFSQTKWNVKQAIDGDRKTGWAISPQFGKPHWATFVLADPISLDSDGSELTITLGQFYGRGRTAGKPRVSFYTGDVDFLSVGADVRKLAVKKKHKPKELRSLRQAFDQLNPQLKSVDRQIQSAQSLLKSLSPDTTLVMVEMEKPRETFVMLRGDYENLGDKVSPGTPSVFGETSPSAGSGDRMELARWMTSSSNPLLARVTVNRWWAELFGTGLVNTSEDFGTQSESPSHPDLLDYLSMQLIKDGWSMKSLHKQIVMSATFRQSANFTPQLLQADPENRLLARGPRLRLPAESIRDNALAISGLLSTKMYGPPIMPFQPGNIWRSVGRNQPKWIAAENEDRFRRGVYVVCKRAAPYPSFINFDAPDRGNCTVRRARTNTPLQALTLLNDPAYAEMALAMADRVLHDTKDQTDEERLSYAMRLAVARDANDIELKILLRLLSQERELLRGAPELVKARTKAPTKSMKLLSGDKPELAAWIAVTNAILNLDETISR